MDLYGGYGGGYAKTVMGQPGLRGVRWDIRRITGIGVTQERKLGNQRPGQTPTGGSPMKNGQRVVAAPKHCEVTDRMSVRRIGSVVILGTEAGYESPHFLKAASFIAQLRPLGAAGGVGCFRLRRQSASEADRVT